MQATVTGNLHFSGGSTLGMWLVEPTVITTHNHHGIRSSAGNHQRRIQHNARRHRRNYALCLECFIGKFASRYEP